MRCFSCNCSTVEIRSRYFAARSYSCSVAAASMRSRRRARQIRLPALEEQLHVAHGFLIRLRRGQALHARPQAALDVVLQAGLRMDRVRSTLHEGTRKWR